jgi:hypothetical protein
MKIYQESTITPLVLILDLFQSSKKLEASEAFFDAHKPFSKVKKKNRKPKLPVFHKEIEFIKTFYQTLKPFYY